MLDQVRGHWVYVAGAGVLVVVAAVLVERARRRVVAARRLLSEQERAAIRDRRGKVVEDVLTVAVAGAAAAMSATQLMKYGQDVMHLKGPWRLLPFAGLDIAAVVCALRARRRARRGASAGVSGALVWTLACVSAVFSAGEAHNPWQAVGRGVWALIAAVLWEIGLAEERYASAPRADRRMGWVRWLHPVERVQVLAELAGDETISADEATRRVRERRTAWALYRLRTAPGIAATAGVVGPATGDAAEDPHRRIRRRAQRAATRARLADPDVETSVLAQLRVLVDVERLAATSWPTPGNVPVPARDTDGPPGDGRGAMPVPAAAVPGVPVAPVFTGPVASVPSPPGPSAAAGPPAVPARVNAVAPVPAARTHVGAVDHAADRASAHAVGGNGAVVHPVDPAVGELTGRQALLAAYEALPAGERVDTSVRQLAIALAPEAGLSVHTARKYLAEARSEAQAGPDGPDLAPGDDQGWVDYDAAGDPVVVHHT